MINYAKITVVINVKKNLYIISCCRVSYTHCTMRFMALHACTSQINFKSCPVQCGPSILRLTNSQYGGDMPELRPVVTLQEIIARIKESGMVPTPSMSSTASLTQAAEDVEPEDTVSDPAVLLTSCERAKDVVERGLLTLDPKLAVFTVVGTQEPRLVKLFLPTVLLVPGHWDVLPRHGGKDGWWHDAHTGTVNLTQLRHNNTETSWQDFRQEAATTARCWFWNFEDF